MIDIHRLPGTFIVCEYELGLTEGGVIQSIFDSASFQNTVSFGNLYIRGITQSSKFKRPVPSQTPSNFSHEQIQS